MIGLSKARWRGGKPCRAGGGNPRRRARIFTSREWRRASPFRSCFSPTEPRRKSWASAGNGRRRRRANRFVSAAAFARPTSRPESQDSLRRAAAAITAACGLRGLNSIDFLVEGRRLYTDRNQSEAWRDPRHFRRWRRLAVPRSSRSLSRSSAQAPARISAARRRRVMSMRGMKSPACRNSTGPTGRRTGRKPRSEVRAHDPLCTINGLCRETRSRPRAPRCAYRLDSRPTRTPPKRTHHGEGNSTLSKCDLSINTLTGQMVDRMVANAARLRVTVSKGEAGETIIDAGKTARGGIEAGLRDRRNLPWRPWNRQPCPDRRQSEMAI